MRQFKRITALVLAVALVLSVGAVVFAMDLSSSGKAQDSQFTVTFNADGGTPEPKAQTIDSGNPATKPVPDPQKADFNFLGWFADGASTPWNFDTVITEDMTLTAKWEAKAPTPSDKVTVTFNADGGTPEPKAQTIDKGTPATEPAQPAKLNFRFLGWFAESSDTPWDFSANVNANMTLTAKWEAVTAGDKVTVTFDTDGGSAVEAQVVDSGSTITKPADPIKAGFKFLGWFNGDVKWSFDTVVNAAMTLKAKWEKINNITVDIDGVTSEIVVGADGKIDESSLTAPDPKPGFTFKGWGVMGPDGSIVPWDFDNDVVTDNITLVPIWKDNSIVEFTVTFDAVGGTPVPAAQTVEDGAKVTEPAEPTRAGFSFGGWYNGITAWDFDNDVVTEDLVLVAKWNELPGQVYHTVTFETNGGSAVAPVRVLDSGVVPEPVAPTKAGFNFNGWYLDSGLTTAYDFDSQVTEDITLYAGWVEVDADVPVVTVPGFDDLVLEFNPDGTLTAASIAALRALENKAGYEFLGWFVDGQKIDIETYVFDEDTVLAPQWKKIDGGDDDNNNGGNNGSGNQNSGFKWPASWGDSSSVKDNPNSGDAGIAMAVAVLAVSAGAVVFARRKK